jgi:hypothetical protein
VYSPFILRDERQKKKEKQAHARDKKIRKIKIKKEGGRVTSG